jgi:hypothetical protein
MRPFPFFPADELTFAVSAVWKGESTPQLVLYQIGCCVCEYGEFHVGLDYLLYATPHIEIPSVLMASFCFPNKLASRAEAELRELGRPAATASRTREAVSLRQRAIRIAKATLARTLDWVFSHHRRDAGPAELFAEWIALLLSPLVVLAVGIGILWRVRGSLC